MPGPQPVDLPADARILAVRLSALGDIVFALPALDALRRAYPEARIDWLVEDRHAAVLRSHPDLGEVLEYPRKAWRSGRGLPTLWRHLRGLRRRGRYDLVLDFQSNLKSALQMCFLRSPCKVGFQKPIAREGAQRFHHRHAEVPPRAHRSRRDLALLHAVGWQGEPSFDGGWPLDPEVVATYADLETPFTLLHTTTTLYGQDKMWPEERWAALADRLAAAGRTVRLLWTPADLPKVEEILGLCGEAAALAPATPSLEHLMALSDLAETLVGTDSGPVHLAAYRGTPVVALFGPTDPAVYRPPGDRVQVVYAGEEGQEPPPRDRSRRSPEMEKICVEAVAEAVLGS